MLRKITALLPVAFAFAFAFTVACSSVSPEQACTDLAQAVCAKLGQCAGGLLDQAYGDVATCAARTSASCTKSLALVNTGDTASIAETCSQGYATLTCSDAFQNNPPKGCVHGAGKLAAGAVCGTSGQCATGVCLAGDNGCGTCGPAAASGGACKATSDCSTGLVCASNVCVTPAGSGAACSATAPCGVGLLCSKSVCTAVLAAGSACDPLNALCDLASGYFCTPKGTRCTAIKFVGAGQPCGYDTTTGDFSSCAGGGFCGTVDQQTGLGTCVAPAADGAACDTTNGPLCEAPATCNAGTCTITDPSTCK